MTKKFYYKYGAGIGNEKKIIFFIYIIFLF